MKKIILAALPLVATMIACSGAKTDPKGAFDGNYYRTVQASDTETLHEFSELKSGKLTQVIASADLKKFRISTADVSVNGNELTTKNQKSTCEEFTSPKGTEVKAGLEKRNGMLLAHYGKDVNTLITMSKADFDRLVNLAKSGEAACDFGNVEKAVVVPVNVQQKNLSDLIKSTANVQPAVAPAAPAAPTETSEQTTTPTEADEQNLTDQLNKDEIQLEIPLNIDNTEQK